MRTTIILFLAAGLLSAGSQPGWARSRTLWEPGRPLAVEGGTLHGTRVVSYERPAKGVITLAFPEPLALPEDAHRIEWPVIWGNSGVSSSGGFTVEFAVRDAAGKEVLFPTHSIGSAGWTRLVSTSLLSSGRPERQVTADLLATLRPRFLKPPLRLTRVVLTSTAAGVGELTLGLLGVSRGAPRDSRLSWRFWGVNEAGHDEEPSFPCGALAEESGVFDVTLVVRRGWQGPVAHWSSHRVALTDDPMSRLERLPVPVRERGTYYLTATLRREGDLVPVARKELILALLNGDVPKAAAPDPGPRPASVQVVPEALAPHKAGAECILPVHLYSPAAPVEGLAWRYTVKECGYWQHGQDERLIPRLGATVAEGGSALDGIPAAGGAQRIAFTPPRQNEAYAVNVQLLAGERVLDEATWLVGAQGLQTRPMLVKDLLPARDFAAANILTCGTNEPYYPESADTWKTWLERTAAMEQPVVEIIAYWANLEPVPGVYRFDWLDRQVRDAKAAGRKVTVHFSLQLLPLWLPREPMANQFGESEWLHWKWYHNLPSPFGPEFGARYTRVLQALVRHYAAEPAVVAWQIWGMRWDNFYQDYTDFRDEKDRVWTDYSPYARDAFARYLADGLKLGLPAINRRYGTAYASPDAVRMPLPVYDRNREIGGYGIDASPEWRALTAFKKEGYRRYITELNLKPIRETGDPRAVLFHYGGGLGALPEVLPDLKRLGGMMCNGGSDTHVFPQISSLFASAGVPFRSESVWFQPMDAIHLDQPLFDALFYGGEGAHFHTMWMVGRTRPGFEEGMARLQRWQEVLRRVRPARPVGIDLAVVWNMDSQLLGGAKTFYHAGGGYWENLVLQWFGHHQALFPCDSLLPADLSRFKAIVASAPVLHAETIRRLAEYARASGTLVLYGDSGERAAETPATVDHPLARAIGFAPAAMESGEVAAASAEGAPFQAGRMVFQARCKVEVREGESVWAVFPDGSPAVACIPCGSGSVVRFCGTPKFIADLGAWSRVFTGIAEHAGARRAADVNETPAYAWHHADGTTHYVGVLRDRTWSGADWAKFHKEGRAPLQVKVFQLPAGRYRVEELTYGEPLGEYTTEALAAGIPVPLLRGEAKVLCLTPAGAGGGR